MVVNQKSLENLLLKIAKGNSESLEELYLQINKLVYSYAYSILKDHECAQDVMQDTFIKINEASTKYKPQGKPLAWILKITKNFCLMTVRKNSREQSTDIEGNEYFLNKSVNYKYEEKLVLKAAFKLLDEGERQIVFLYLITGMKHREIAQILGKPLGTILWKYNTALKKLKKELKSI